MPDRVATTAFEDVEKPAQVAVEIGTRILQGVTHAGLGGEVDHHLGSFGGKQIFHGRRIGQVNR